MSVCVFPCGVIVHAVAMSGGFRFHRRQVIAANNKLPSHEPYTCAGHSRAFNALNVRFTAFRLPHYIHHHPFVVRHQALHNLSIVATAYGGAHISAVGHHSPMRSHARSSGARPWSLASRAASMRVATSSTLQIAQRTAAQTAPHTNAVPTIQNVTRYIKNINVSILSTIGFLIFVHQ